MEGGADQSFGLHVAKLAGLPSEVVERARDIQAILEKDDEMVRKLKAKRLQEQLSLEKFWSAINKNPNRPKGRGIFNVSDTPSDNGELMQNNPTTASSGVSETNKVLK